MSSFLASTSAESVSFNDPLSGIKNDGWFPDIDVAKARAAMRLDGTVTPPRLREALVAAIISINRQLQGWQRSQQVTGYEDLESVPAPTVDGLKTIVSLYQRAVCCTAKADLIEHYRDFDTTSEGNRKMDLLDPSIGEQRRNAQWAVADIKGETRVTVELI
jgi:hypothetical protein